MSEKNYIERYWRDVKPEDAIKDPPMVARFRIDATDKWSIDTLQGIDRSAAFKWIGKNNKGKECQVYDAPDPGEGWRLIDPDKDNYNQDGIEFWNKDKNTWVDRWACKGRAFLTDTFYRIRIAPTVTYVPFTWEDREQLRGRWIESLDGDKEFQCSTLYRNELGKLYVEGRSALALVERWRFVDTKKPVGKEVTQ